MGLGFGLDGEGGRGGRTGGLRLDAPRIRVRARVGVRVRVRVRVKVRVRIRVRVRVSGDQARRGTVASAGRPLDTHHLVRR